MKRRDRIVLVATGAVALVLVGVLALPPAAGPESAIAVQQPPTEPPESAAPAQTARPTNQTGPEEPSEPRAKTVVPIDWLGSGA